MKKLIALAALAAATTVVTTATTALAHTSSSKASIDVGVLLPDTKSSVRWQTQDRAGSEEGVRGGRPQGLRS